ncbi:MAG: cache domain-containing protein [Thermoanaerobaculia bacterium]|nr:cache domain-containing protein [Thermoanaerobaculia bacterium]
MRRLAGVCLIAILAATAGFADDSGKKSSRSEAKAIVEKGVELFAEKGAEDAVRIINQRSKPFLDRDLYLFVIGPDGSIVAHAFDESRIGIPAEELYDEDGQPYGKLMLKLANEEGTWVPYRQYNPVTKKVEPKSSYVRKAHGHIFGCGVYGD